MELRHVLGSTYVAVAATALLPIYKLNDTDIVLLDTGYAKLDPTGLTHLLENNGDHLKGILCAHAHVDREQLPGLGQVDWGRFIGALYAVGYDQVVSIEHEDRRFEGSVELVQRGFLIARNTLRPLLA